MPVVKRSVNSFSKDGSTPLKGDVTISEGTGVTLTQTGQDIEIAASAGSGDVSKVGTPVNNQIGVWTGDGTIEGDANLTFDTTTDTLSTVTVTASGAVTGSNLSGTNTGDNATNTQYSGLVSNATHTGDATGATALTVVGINGTSLAGLATGILKNTTTTGVPSIAIAGDFPTLNQNTTGTASNVTGTVAVANGGTGITSLGTGVATFLGTPSSANLATAVTDETGTGSLVFATSPALVSPTATAGMTSTVTGASATVPLTITVDSSIATQSGLLVKDANNFAHTGDLIKAQLLNGTDSGRGLRIENSGTGANISSANGTSETFSVSKTGAVVANSLALTTDIAVADGGTGRSTGTTAYSLVATGTTATGAQQTLANGATTEILVGGGASALPVWTTAQGSGAPVRATSPTLTTPNLGTPSTLVLTNATGLPTAGISDSAVTNEKLGATVGFYATTTQSMPNGATTAVTTYTEVADYGADFVHTTGVFTAPYAGLYHFDACMAMQNVTSATDGRWEGIISVGGVTKCHAFTDADTTNGDPAVSMSLTMPLAASDTVTVSVVNLTGGDETLDSYSFFAGYLVGRV